MYVYLLCKYMHNYKIIHAYKRTRANTHTCAKDCIRPNPLSQLESLHDSHGNFRPIANDFLMAKSFNPFLHNIFSIFDNILPAFDRRTSAQINLPVFNSDEVCVTRSRYILYICSLYVIQ